MTIFLILILHIICGFFALFSAFGAIFTAKGKQKHRQFGRFFFYSMTGLFVTALPLSIIKRNLFLFLIAVFSYYLAFSGWRYAKNRLGQFAKLDVTISAIMLVISLIMLGVAFYSFNLENFKSVTLLVFGIIGGFFSISDIKIYLYHKAVGQFRIVKHLSAMLGATIAAITAFLVTNVKLDPPIILWLGPTVLLTPVIVWWKNKIQKDQSYS
ncbi:hypothetical protein [Legionella fairfieldensis]|uniref:hypothetical protein n=1 Tax=Legionella fairfieldensis TaxID=45064 RepID=UPI0005603353|nr:hypothetical protein [Legionella fairfieldensis]